MAIDSRKQTEAVPTTILKPVKLITSTPLDICSRAIRTCWQSHEKSDSEQVMYCEKCNHYYTDLDTKKCNCGNTILIEQTYCGEKDKELIDRIGNKFKHASTLEHLIMTFSIDFDLMAYMQMNENKYIVYNFPVLTLNLRSFIDMLELGLKHPSVYEARNKSLLQMYNVFPKDYKYLVEERISHLIELLAFNTKPEGVTNA
jgi:thymidylate synthase (FAD)